MMHMMMNPDIQKITWEFPPEITNIMHTVRYVKHCVIIIVLPTRATEQETLLFFDQR